MVLRVTLNTEDKGDLFVARNADGDFLLKLADLKAIGFKAPTGAVLQFDGEAHLSLRSMAGVSFVFDEKVLALNITADPADLPERGISLRGERRPRGVAAASNSAFLNYAIDYSKGSIALGRNNPGVALESGWRLGDFLATSNGSTITRSDGSRKFVRLMSSVTHDDRDTLRRTVIGDFFSPAREFGTSVNLAGLSVSKFFGIDPYLTKAPTQTISGAVALPSDLEVYLDGQRVRSERIQPGQFEVRDILAYGGSRSVQVLLRDSFGRVQQLNYSFYFSDEPLQQGLHEYSYNLGALRRGFGIDSSRYGSLAYSAYHRYGLSNAVTAGLRAEGTQKLANAGASASIVLGSAGVTNLAVARSSYEGRQGSAASVGFNYQSRFWNAGFSLRREWGEFATLGEPVTITSRRYEGNAVVGINLGRASLSLTHSALKLNPGASASASVGGPFAVPLQNRRITALTYTTPLLSDKMSLIARLSHIKDRVSRNEGFVGLLYFFDRDYGASASFRGDGGSLDQSYQFTKNQPIGEGLGYVLSADRTTGPETEMWVGRSRLQYNAAAAILRGELSSQRQGKTWTRDYRLSLAGGVAYVDGRAALGRPIEESFGIVKVGELAGVKVLLNGQDMGLTNARGELFIPTLSPFFDTEIALVPSTLPIDYSIPSVLKRISPSLRSGVVIDFGVTKMQAFTGILQVRRGATAKSVDNEEFALVSGGTTATYRTGRKGDFYLENLLPGRYPATVRTGGQDCTFEISIPASGETFVELGVVVCELPL